MDRCRHPYDGADPNAPLNGVARQATAPPPAVPPTKPIVAVKLKPGEVSFAAEVAPVLVENCVGCHDIDQPDANLSMITFDRLLRGGRGGSPVTPSKGADSLLVKKLKGAGAEGQRMPLGKPPLAADVIADREMDRSGGQARSAHAAGGVGNTRCGRPVTEAVS